MNCCGRKEDKNCHKKGRLSHFWMMVLCCGAPVLVLLLVPLLGARFPGVGAFLISIAPLLCPALMAGMVPLMLIGRKRADREDRRPDPAESDVEEKPHGLR